jgi:hypothetical protein
MLASINPLGERSRNRSWGATFTWYVAGSVAGGVAMGAAFGLLGVGLDALLPGDDTLTALLVLGCALLALAYDLHLFGLQLPTIVRQVDENWLPRYRAWVYAGGFGLQLGLGVVTVVTTSAVYLTWIFAALAGSVWGGIVIGATFGLVRALPMLLVARADTPGLLRARLRAFAAAAPLATRVTTVVVFSLPVVALTALMLGGGA